MHHLSSLFAVSLYLVILIMIGVSSHKKHLTSTDFILGSRKMNFWLTALAAHASDMSGWIFMGYPAVIFTAGLLNVWVAFGLTFFMFLNWQFVAPRLRTMTEKYGSLTLSSFFESRYSDTSGTLRIFTVLISFIYYAIYISALLVGLGLLLETLFGLSFIWGTTIGICIIVPYLFFGGYITLAWTDLFQAIFLLCAIIFIPFYVLPSVGGWQGVQEAIALKANYQPIFPDFTPKTLFSIFLVMTSWGLGYFGMPHVITKFMGINNVKEMPKSKWIGISWQILSLSAATLVGLVAIAFFKDHAISDPQLVFVNMTLSTLPAFVAAFILCAILGATITSMDSMILVLASNLTEDFYKKVLRKNATSRELLFVSRLSIIFIAILAYILAYKSKSTVYAIVAYAWYGLGASFGPLILFSLYSERVNRYGAWGGLITGALVAGFWPFIASFIPLDMPALKDASLIPGFIISSFTIWAVSIITEKKKYNDLML
jgi:sodium/proline symporter